MNNRRPMRAILPNGSAPHDVTEVIAGCEFEHGRCFIKGAEIVQTTDILGTPVSLSMIKGPGQPMQHYEKKLVRGSCVMFGQLNGDLIFTTDYFQAKKINAIEGYTTVCCFESLNMLFLVKELERRSQMVNIICHSKEDWIQAEKCGHLLAYDKELGHLYRVSQMIEFFDDINDSQS